VGKKKREEGIPQKKKNVLFLIPRARREGVEGKKGLRRICYETGGKKAGGEQRRGRRKIFGKDLVFKNLGGGGREGSTKDNGGKIQSFLLRRTRARGERNNQSQLQKGSRHG